MNTTWEYTSPPQNPAAWKQSESKLKLSLETRSAGDVMILHCQGRIIYRDEAAMLSRLVTEVLQHTRLLVLDLSGVESIDSAGIGELVLVHTRAQGKGANLKFAGPNPHIRSLLELTHLDSVLEIHPTIRDAISSFREEVWAPC